MGRAVGFLVLLLMVSGFYVFNTYIYRDRSHDGFTATDYKNGQYLIDGMLIELYGGISQVPAAPGSASMITTRYFGNEARGDFDKDGDEDVSFLLTYDGGGSGIFFYLVGAIKEDTGYRGTEGILIGDRIAPQSTEFRNGIVIVNYADRERGEPMTAEPSVAESVHLKYDPAAKNFMEVPMRTQ